MQSEMLHLCEQAEFGRNLALQKVVAQIQLVQISHCTKLCGDGTDDLVVILESNKTKNGSISKASHKHSTYPSNKKRCPYKIERFQIRHLAPFGWQVASDTVVSF